MNIQPAMPPTIDFASLKARQQAAWASGDYAVVGATLQIVGEALCEAVDLRSNQRVLDVAAGNGNATLAAARRFADVVSTDYVTVLLDRGRERARAEGLDVTVIYGSLKSRDRRGVRLYYGRLILNVSPSGFVR
jgi:cyclopropane fatty-acyl-phospholipid synthase-like methyltransferase